VLFNQFHGDGIGEPGRILPHHADRRARRACSLEDSILERMLDSRLLGLNTFAMDGHLLLMDSYSPSDVSLYKEVVPDHCKQKKGGGQFKKSMQTVNGQRVASASHEANRASGFRDGASTIN
jgi:hypothetical protein